MTINDIASIRAELNKLTARQGHTIRGSAEYNANLLKIKQLREILNQHNMDLKYTSAIPLVATACPDANRERVSFL